MPPANETKHVEQWNLYAPFVASRTKNNKTFFLVVYPIVNGLCARVVHVRESYSVRQNIFSFRSFLFQALVTSHWVGGEDTNIENLEWKQEISEQICLNAKSLDSICHKIGLPRCTADVSTMHKAT